MQKELISIILPAYNAERYITKCIESVLRQSYQNWELILIDDGSTDDTENIAKSFAEENSRIKYYKLKNGGVSNARNFGLEEASGEFIFFLDADDYLAEKCLEDLIAVSIENNADIVISAHREIDELNKKTLENNKFLETEILDDKNILNTFLMTDKIGWEVWGKLYRRMVLSGTRFDKKLRIAEDAVFLFETLMRSKKIVLLKKYGYNYRINMGSVMVQSFNEKNLDIIEAISKIEKMAKNIYQFEIKAFKLKYYIWFLRRYNCKVAKRERQKYLANIKVIRNAVREEKVKNAILMLSKKYVLEFILIKYFYWIYVKFVRMLYKCKII